MVSSTPGTQYDLIINGTAALGDVSITDANNTGTIVNEYSDATVVSGGNTSGWAYSTTSAYTWLGDTSVNWNAGSNWAGGSAPGTGNKAIFDGATSSNVATVNATTSIGGMNIEADYTGTITQGSSVVLTVGSQDWVQAGGTYLPGAETININGDWTHSGGTFTEATSTVKFGFQTGGVIVTTGSMNFNNLTLAVGSLVSCKLAGTTTIKGTFNVSSCSNWNGTGTVNLEGDFTTGTYVTYGSLSNLVFTGTGNQSITTTHTSFRFHNITINRPSESEGTDVTLNNNIYLNLGWTNTAGTVDINGNSVNFRGTTDRTINDSSTTFANVDFNTSSQYTDYYLTGTMNIDGNLTISNGARKFHTGTFLVSGNVTSTSSRANTGSAKLTMDGGSNATITSNTRAVVPSKITIAKTGGAKVTAQDNMIATTSGQDLTITSGVLDLAGYNLTVNDVFTLSASGVLQLQGGETVSNLDAIASGSTVTYNGTGSYLTALPVCEDDTNNCSNLIFNGSGGVWELGSALTVDNNLTITNGTLDIDSQDLTVTGTFSNAGTLRMAGAETLSLTMDTDSGTITYDGSGTYASGLIGGDAYNNLTINGSGTWDLDANLDVNGNLSLTSGTLEANSYSLNVAGNWNKTSGSFTAGTSTVILDGTSQSILGSNTFYNLTKSVTSSDTLTFENGKTQTVTNILTLGGNSNSNRLSLRSNSGGTRWVIDAQSVANLSNSRCEGFE